MIDLRRRDEQDAATVIAILTALAAAGGEPEPDPADRSVWGDPAHRLRLAPASPVAWWASGLPR
ncbi:acyl-CoA carboxylase epsilon subunit [Nakamurella sp.]|uniref:acyl-CoA carboxylase epsilon subunit n=1 Tax=Nakamurella sp. TaxID=1869182 RepID=UPI003B3B0818